MFSLYVGRMGVDSEVSWPGVELRLFDCGRRSNALCEQGMHRGHPVIGGSSGVEILIYFISGASPALLLFHTRRKAARYVVLLDPTFTCLSMYQETSAMIDRVGKTG